MPFPFDNVQTVGITSSRRPRRSRGRLPIIPKQDKQGDPIDILGEWVWVWDEPYIIDGIQTYYGHWVYISHDDFMYNPWSGPSGGSKTSSQVTPYSRLPGSKRNIKINELEKILESEVQRAIKRMTTHRDVLRDDFLRKIHKSKDTIKNVFEAIANFNHSWGFTYKDDILTPIEIENILSLFINFTALLAALRKGTVTYTPGERSPGSVDAPKQDGGILDEYDARAKLESIKNLKEKINDLMRKLGNGEVIVLPPMSKDIMLLQLVAELMKLAELEDLLHEFISGRR